MIQRPRVAEWWPPNMSIFGNPQPVNATLFEIKIFAGVIKLVV